MGEGGPLKSPLHSPYSRQRRSTGILLCEAQRNNAMEHKEETQAKARRKDLPPIKVYVLPEEAENLTTLAAAAGLPVSVYLRKVGLGTPMVTSRLDCERARELVRIGADLNRIGGLLKALLSNDERFSGAYGLTLQRATMNMIEDLGVTNAILKEKSRQLLQ